MAGADRIYYGLHVVFIADLAAGQAVVFQGDASIDLTTYKGANFVP